MPTNYMVREGDCIESIAAGFGFFAETIWDHPENARLKESRKDANILLPGDTVVIADREIKQADGATEKKHTFKRKGIPCLLQIRILKFGIACADEPYVLIIDGVRVAGQTDSDGWLKEPISPKAREGLLTLGKEGSRKRRHVLRLGGLAPKSEIAGIQHRLNNLGHPCQATSRMDAGTQSALLAFQAEHGLHPNGEPDADTRDKLAELHGS